RPLARRAGLDLPVKRGEVRWYRFSSPNKKRPVLILTRDAVLDYLGEATIAPITSTIREIPSEVVLGDADGMPRDCAINFDHVQTVPQERLGALITTIDRRRWPEIRAALLFALATERHPRPERTARPDPDPRRS